MSFKENFAALDEVELVGRLAFPKQKFARFESVRLRPFGQHGEMLGPHSVKECVLHDGFVDGFHNRSVLANGSCSPIHRHRIICRWAEEHASPSLVTAHPFLPAASASRPRRQPLMRRSELN